MKIPSPLNLIESNQYLDEALTDFYALPNISEFQKSFVELYKKKFDKDFAILENDFKLAYATEYQAYRDALETITNMQISGLSSEMVAKYLRTSPMESLIENLNQELMKGVSQESLLEAVRKWTYSDWDHNQTLLKGQIVPKNLEELLKLTSKKVIPNYFNELPFLDIVGKTSVKNEVDVLNQTIFQLEEDYQMQALIQKHVKGFLNSIITDDLKHKEILFGITRTGTENDTLVIPKSDENSGFVYYNKGNELSLFLGLFKYNAANIDWTHDETAKLKTILSDWNLKAKSKINLQNFSPKKFFAGFYSTNEDNKNDFIEGDFHKFIKELSTKHLIQLVDLLAENSNIKDKGKFKDNALKVFKWIDPKKYGTAIFSSERIASSEYDMQTLKNIESRIHIIANKFGIYNNTDRDKYFDALETKSESGEDSIQNVYLYLKNKLDFGKDLIKIKSDSSQGFDKFITVTKLTPSKDGMFVKGITIDGGIPSEKTYFIKAETNKEKNTETGKTTTTIKQFSIEFRKFETSNEPYVTTSPGILEKAFLIKSTDGSSLSKSLIKKYIQVGSLVLYKDSSGKIVSDTVKGVLPGVIVTLKNRYPIKFSNIVEFNSTKLSSDDLRDWKELDFKTNPHLSVETVNAKSLATAGDVIEYTDSKGVKRINKVLDSDKDSVSIIIKTASTSYIERIERAKITKALIEISTTTINELNEAAKNITAILLDSSIRDNTYSYSENLEEAKDGDIFIKFGDTSDQNIYYKLIDKSSNKVIQRTGLTSKDYQVEILDTNAVKGFLTKRDISTIYSLDIDRVNNQKIYPSKDSDKSNVVYLVPERLKDLSKAILFDSLHFNVGQIVGSEHYKKNIERYENEGLVDVTSQALTLISRKLNSPIKSLNNKTIHTSDIGKPIYEKFIDDLFRINYFSELSSDDKIDAFQVGAYLKLSKGNTPGNKLFRIAEDFGNNVLLEYSILDLNGNVKSIKYLMSKTELANKISAFYLIKGNSKIQSLLKKTNQKTKEDNRTKEDVREAFIYTIQSVFKESNIDINVRVVPALGNFEANTQKAKIQNGEILISKEDGTATDVVHEFLHVFLIGLKYSSIENSEKYKTLMLDFWNTELKSNPEINSFDKMEEAFVHHLSQVLVKQQDLDFSSLEKIESAILEGIKSVGLDADNLVSYDLYSVLNTDLKKLLKVPGRNKNFTDLLVFEASFRNWIAENIANGNLNIKCE